MLAMGEAYALTGDPALGESVRRALELLRQAAVHVVDVFESVPTGQVHGKKCRLLVGMQDIVLILPQHAFGRAE